MSYQITLMAMLMGAALYPFFSNHMPNQRQNAAAVIGSVLLGLMVFGQFEFSSLGPGQPLHYAVSLLSFLFFASAFLKRRRGKVLAAKMAYGPFFCGVVLSAADAIPSNPGLELLLVFAQWVCLALIVKSYGNLPSITRYKALYFASLYCLVNGMYHLTLTRTLTDNGKMIQATGWLTGLLLLSSVVHMLFQDFSRNRTKRQWEEHTKVDPEVVRLAFRGRRVLKDFRHDLRQPLSTLGILASVGKAISKDPEVSTRYQHIQTAQKALKNMLEEFFEQLSEAIRYPIEEKIAPLKHVKIDDLLTPLVEEYRMLAQGKGLQIRYVPNNAEVLTNREALTKILRNGLDNAIKYTERGGVVVGTRRRGAQVCLQIADTGSGIESDRVATHNKGWGHGSAMIRELSEQILAKTACRNRYYGGQLAGSVFEVLLPGDNDLQRRSHPVAARNNCLLEARVLALNEKSLQDVRAMLPTQGFDLVQFAVSGAYKAYLQALKQGMASVYVMYAGTEAEVSEGEEQLRLLGSLLDFQPCCILIENTTEAGAKSVQFTREMIRIPCNPGRNEHGLSVIHELFPPREPKMHQLKQPGQGDNAMGEGQSIAPS
ncbi:MAG TPA: HAMP domain-containing sensor histidine kinase, partial [Limnobacter sp.]|nr:HAMP domain-containing sensor histidine kinase [Limnobacter sp.]